jgi:hypothetical protein
LYLDPDTSSSWSSSSFRSTFDGTTITFEHQLLPESAARGELAAAAAAGVTGLVIEGELATSDDVGWRLRDYRCPLAGAVSFDRTTGEFAWYPTCKSARCPDCSRQVSAQTFALARKALADEPHLRFITLTRAPEGWEVLRIAMKTWTQFLRRLGYVMHVLWVVERGSQKGMKHVHVLQWGSYIPKHVLDASWPYGMTQIEGAREATDYLGKGVIRYVAKGIDESDLELVQHMNLNGGRAAHWSREFFGGLSRDGYRKANPLPGIYFVATAREDARHGAQG